VYPYFRLVTTYFGARRRPRLGLSDESRIRLRALPGDVDFYPELNNGRHLTLMDLGRLDLAVRTGLIALLRPRGWGLAVAGASVRYRHRIPLLARFLLVTRLVGRDRLWFYVEQRTELDGRVRSSALLRVGITGRQGVVPTAEVLTALGDVSLPEEVPEWVAAWAAADTQRPWPEPAPGGEAAR